MIMTKIFIVDDHEVVREGLKRIILEASDMMIVGEAENGRDALKKIRASDCNMVLLDISLPDISGLEVLKQLKVERPQLPVLILTVHPEDRFAKWVFKAGASGYLTKENAKTTHLIEAIRTIAQGRKYVSRSLAESTLNWGEKLPHERLSGRECDVVIMIASGKKVNEIAKVLSRSEKTISSHLARAREKMNMKSNAEIIRYVIENRLI